MEQVTLVGEIRKLKEELENKPPESNDDAMSELIEELKTSQQDYVDLMNMLLGAVQIGTLLMGEQMAIQGAIQTALQIGYRLRDNQIRVEITGD
jgi:hypothetical protein